MLTQSHKVEELLLQMVSTSTKAALEMVDLLVNGLLISFKLELIQLLTLALTQTKLPVLTKLAPPQETLHGPHSPHQELEIQLLPKLHHTQDMLSTEIDRQEFER